MEEAYYTRKTEFCPISGTVSRKRLGTWHLGRTRLKRRDKRQNLRKWKRNIERILTNTAEIEQRIVSEMDLSSMFPSSFLLLLFVKACTSDGGPGVDQRMPPTGGLSLMSTTIVSSTSEQPGKNFHLIRFIYLFIKVKQYNSSNLSPNKGLDDDLCLSCAC